MLNNRWQAESRCWTGDSDIYHNKPVIVLDDGFIESAIWKDHSVESYLGLIGLFSKRYSESRSWKIGRRWCFDPTALAKVSDWHGNRSVYVETIA